MSKIICDVCGTSYQESATQCPICGCVRPSEISTAAEASANEMPNSGNYTYVKGGRFSKSNVQKRNRGVTQDDARESEGKRNANNKGDKGLVIAVIALLLAIIGVVIYIAIHFFAPAAPANKPADTQATTLPQVTEQATTVPTDVLCTEIVLSATEVTLESQGATQTLNALLTPEDTTDVLVFVSENDAVATVSDAGVITAVGAGETTINVTCGNATAQCRVVCNILEEPTAEPTVQETPAVVYKAPYRISKTDVSISVNETFQLKLLDAKGQIIPVTWSASVADICTVDGNAVTGAMKGKTELSATYDGQTFTCIIRVR